MPYDCFRAVLEDLNQVGRDELGSDWEPEVTSALTTLEASYKELLNSSRSLIDYSELPAQTAYTFVYAVGRAEFTYEILKRFKDQAGKPLFGKRKLRIVSIGGGPASELVGLVKYLQETSAEENVGGLTYDVYDKEENWEHVASQVVANISGVSIQGPNYFQLDLADTTECSQINLHEADLVILSFVISEVCCLPDSDVIKKNVASVLSTLSTGAHVLYNDSDAYSFYTCMNLIAAKTKGLTQMGEVQDLIAISAPDLSGEFEDMIEIHDRTPHLNSKAVAKLFVMA